MGCFHSKPDRPDSPSYPPNHPRRPGSLTPLVESFLGRRRRLHLRNSGRNGADNDEKSHPRDDCVYGSDCPWRDATPENYMQRYLHRGVPHRHNIRSTDRDVGDYQYHYRIEDQEEIGPDGGIKREYRIMDEWNVDGVRGERGGVPRRGRGRSYQRRPQGRLY
jgi:hypothetical protein